MFDLVGPKGVFAAQIPQYDQMPISKVISEVAPSPRWFASLGKIDPGNHFYPDKRYYEWLSDPKFDVRMWATEYYHVMDDNDRIIEMMTSTGLKTYLAHLGEEGVTELTRSVKGGLEKAYPPQSDGKVLFPFKRLFLLASKK